MPPSHIGILGGGLSGLSAAFHLARRFPSPATRITLIEAAPRLGGWVRSERVALQTEDGRKGSVLLEAGPRTLRPNSPAVLELINLLNLEKSLITVPRTAPAAQNRFLHIPGTRGLARIPTAIPSMITSPLGKMMMAAVLRDLFKSSNGPSSDEPDTDESVDAFLTRRFGPKFAQTFGSALVHGIYAADSRMLSVRAAFPMLYDLTRRGKGSVVRGAIKSAFSKSDKTNPMKGYDVGDIKQKMEAVSVFSFKDGLETIVKEMELELDRLGVQMVKGDPVSSFAMNGTESEPSFEVTTASGSLYQFSHFVSALPLPRLHTLLETSGPSRSEASAMQTLDSLTTVPASSVTVVNLVFPAYTREGRPLRLHPPGFGYLVPRPNSGYISEATRPENPLGVLGTVFDSCALSDQDEIESPSGGGPPFIKMTVMIGGPYYASLPYPWNDNLQLLLPFLPRTLSTHMSVELPVPICHRVHHHSACIPPPGAGHLSRVRELRDHAKKLWRGRGEIIGAGVGGVSVGDCIEGGRRAGLEW